MTNLDLVHLNSSTRLVIGHSNLQFTLDCTLNSWCWGGPLIHPLSSFIPSTFSVCFNYVLIVQIQKQINIFVFYKLQEKILLVLSTYWVLCSATECSHELHVTKLAIHCCSVDKVKYGIPSENTLSLPEQHKVCCSTSFLSASILPQDHHQAAVMPQQLPWLQCLSLGYSCTKAPVVASSSTICFVGFHSPIFGL